MLPTKMSNHGGSHPPSYIRYLAGIKKPATCAGFLKYGGEGGIRTPGRDEPTSDFKSGALNRALPPLLQDEANINDLFMACKG